MVSSDACDVSVEFAHLYHGELAAKQFDGLRPAAETVRRVLRQLDMDGVTWSLSVLIDDYGAAEARPATAELRAFMANVGIKIHHVAYEGDLAAEASKLLDGIRLRACTRTMDRFILRSESADPHLSEAVMPGIRPKSRLLGLSPRSMLFDQKRSRSRTEVVLTEERSGETRYGCALLASCWALARLGVEPYRASLRLESVDGSPPFVGKRLVTVLPTDYMKVEATVFDLLGEHRDQSIRRSRSRMHYVFHSGGV